MSDLSVNSHASVNYVHHPRCDDGCRLLIPKGFTCWGGFGDALYHERVRAHLKHASGSAESIAPRSFTRWLSILGEEYGEVCREICEFDLGNQTWEETRANLQKELVQLAAMSEAFHEALKDRGE